MSPSVAATPSPAAEVADWPQYHRNAMRTGVGPATPAVDSPTRAWSRGVDARMWASPLIVGGRVIAATENNTVYSLDLRSGAVIWSRHLGTPVNASTLPCGNIRPVTGITGTPAADPLTGELFVVAFLSGYHHKLFVLNLGDGSVKHSLAVDPAGSSPIVEQQRPALSVTADYVYISYGGLAGDCGAYHGYLMAVPRAGGGGGGFGKPLIYKTPSAGEAGFWESMGVTISDTGTVYAINGNGSPTSSFDFSNTLYEMSPDLKIKSYFAPSNWRQLDGGDVDFGSVGVAFLPALGRLVTIGKEGVVYLLRSSGLGGVGGQVASAHVCDGAWGGSAWIGSRVFLPCIDGLVAVDVAPSGAGVSRAWQASGVHMASPIIAAGAVWAIDVNTSTLFALNIDSGAVLYSLGLGAAEHFATPAATQGFVVVPAGSSVVAVAVAPAAA